MKKIRPPLRVEGSKPPPWILEHFPENYEQLNYCEMCCGGGGVFLNKSGCKVEMLNDVDRRITSVFKALRDEPKEFIGKLKRLKCKETTFHKALERSKDTIEDYLDLALNEYVLRWMSKGSHKKTFAWKAEETSEKTWVIMLKQLPTIAKRLQGVVILNCRFQEIFKVWDDINTLIYIDPPSLPLDEADLDQNELPVDEHVTLLNLIRDARGKVLVSGFASPLYTKYLANWKQVKVLSKKPQQVKERRYLCLWRNF